jgi:hypothetical protein
MGILALLLKKKAAVAAVHAMGSQVPAHAVLYDPSGASQSYTFNALDNGLVDDAVEKWVDRRHGKSHGGGYSNLNQMQIQCNSCRVTFSAKIPHYHCSSCDYGEYDLCNGCVARGYRCYGNHRMDTRFVYNGVWAVPYALRNLTA